MRRITLLIIKTGFTIVFIQLSAVIMILRLYLTEPDRALGFGLKLSSIPAALEYILMSVLLLVIAGLSGEYIARIKE